MSDKPGHLWALIQEWMDGQPYPPSQARLAARIQVSKSTLGEWKYGRGWPGPDALERLADEIGVHYDRVLDAVIADRGYDRGRRRSREVG